jgi:hypothetical protein
MAYFQQQNTTFKADGSKRVLEIKLKLVMRASKGEVGVTDLMLQRGVISTEWAAHPSEIKWTANE